MAIQNSSIHDLIEKVTSWFSWGERDKSWFSEKNEIPHNSAKMCCECDSNFTELGIRYHCQSCGRLFCGICIQRYGYGSSVAVVGSDVMKSKSCKFCEEERKFSGKIYPSLSPRESLEPPSPRSSVTSFSGHPSPLVFTRCSSRSDGEETEDIASQVFRLLGEYYPYDVSDIDTNSIRVSDDFYDFKSAGTSPSDSPSRNNYTFDSVVGPRNDGPFDHDLKANFKMPEIMVGDLENTNLSISSEPYDKKPLDFENNGLIWFPPPVEDDETDENCFVYDDDDDIEESGTFFSSSMFSAKEKHEGNKEPLREVIEAHFRALVSQLLQGEGIIAGEDWLDIVTTLAWQAANYVKPNTSRGGSMDPCDYVKVKCIATGSPSDSIFVKGVVCTKNITHKRMISQYKTPRLLILGGALEYPRVPNQLSSFDTLLQQEIDHLKMIISKIEAHRPNVVLVEKSVSSYAQEYLLAKEISLVLNVKRPLLERIARCTGALITPSVDSISSARLGHCELFRLERVSEDLDSADQSKRKPAKTLMFFDGCPRRLGCTVLLKGTCRQELKKLKDVFHYAVFAAYHLSLETSFLADEGASLPKLTLKPSITTPEGEFADNTISPISNSNASTICHTLVVFPVQDEDSAGLNGEVGECDALSDNSDGTSIELWNPAAHVELLELSKPEKIDDDTETSIDNFSATDSHQSLLVSFSSRCVLKGTLCERSRLMRIKFYGCFDKPIGRYLQDDLFNKKMYCKSCNELAEAHLQCYTHQQGSLTISVRRIPNLKLPGERDGKIWMWHRCLRCAHIDGIPPATRRVVMSDAACGLSFGKFLELSFSNHATANRVASCGHSLQRDCLRYYGFGSMVALFRYTPIDILSVCLPPSMIEFNNHAKQDWITKESEEIFSKMDSLYAGISNFLYSIEQRNTSSGHNSAETTELHKHIMELKILVEKERNDYGDLLQLSRMDPSLPGQQAIDILELNRLRHSLIIGSDVWDSRLSSIDSLFKTRNSKLKKIQSNASSFTLNFLKSELSIKNGKADSFHEHNEESSIHFSETEVLKESMSSPSLEIEEKCLLDKEINVENTESDLSDKIDSAWTGTHQHHVNAHDLYELRGDGKKRPISQIDSPPLDRLKSNMRIHSFDSAIRVQERVHKELNHPTSLHLSTHKSFHDSSEPMNMVNTNSQKSPGESHKLISCASQMVEGARFLFPQTGRGNIVIAVYDNEPTSIISYALSSKEYEDLVADNLCENDRSFSSKSSYKEGYNVPSFSTWQSFGSLDLEYMQYSSFGSEDASSSSLGSVYQDNTKKSPHLRICFGDDSLSASGKVKFSVTCYFAKQFDLLRKKCCPSEVDFMRSLSRCKRWSAQGGKSNVYFAKSFDDRFIIKQVTKTELDSFGEFAPEYFKYLTDSLGSGSPTCLAKIVGIYQVSVKHLKGGKETKMELMVMENLFFRRNISRVYDLKGSVRSRYNPDTTGANTVLLDMNLLETLCTKPIFLGSKAKRNLERAVWNDTFFLASVDVMDYSLLVGVDEERNELVIGIIDIMRQYTWDKHLETWVKASGILGGPKNVSPTIISPKQYKKRFRKAMTTYFLTVPDQWSS